MKAAIWNHSFWIVNTDPDDIKKLYDQLLKTAGFTIIKFNDYHFKPQGYSAFWLLAESHFAAHTFPEEDKTYCELSSCNFDMYIKFKDLIQ